MFRLQGLPERDSVEEKRQVREGVIGNFMVFGAMVALLRIIPFVSSQINK